MEVQNTMPHENEHCCGRPVTSDDISTLIDVQFLLYRRLSNKMAKLSEQVAELVAINEELKATIADEAVELGEKIDALEAKIVELGEVDPDLANLIADMRSNIDAVEALSGTELPPVEEPTEPETPEEPEVPVEEPAEPETPVEEPVEEPEAPVEEPVEETPAEGGETFPDENV
jgi:outer membrane biosynthesis protein TonB